MKLIVLWYHSYDVAELWPGRVLADRTYLVASKQGAVVIMVLRRHGAPGWWEKQRRSYPVDDELAFPHVDMRHYRQTLGFGWIENPLYMVMRSTQTLANGKQFMMFGAATASLRGAGPVFPYWFLVLLVSGISAISVSKWPPRISLRGLFIAVTVVAITLGMEVTFRR